MTGYVLALSGAIGAGKTKLGEALERALQADHVSFGQAVRDYAKEMQGRDPERTELREPDRSALQELGQALVLTQCRDFVRRTLAQRPRQLEEGAQDLDLIVQGVRHVEILLQLKAEVQGRPVHLIHIETPSPVREDRVMRRDQVERRLVARYDNDITEAQVSRILPQYSRLKIRGDLPLDLQVDAVTSWLKDLRTPAAA